MQSNDRKILIYVHTKAQKFVNKARSCKFSPLTLAIEYFDMIEEYRYYYGIYPESECNIYNRLPAHIQESIDKEYLCRIES